LFSLTNLKGEDLVSTETAALENEGKTKAQKEKRKMKFHHKGKLACRKKKKIVQQT